MGAKTALRKALTSTGDGAVLQGYDLDPVLNEELLAMQPLAVLLDVANANGKTHEYNVRTSHPEGWFEGELTGANPKNSVYARKSVQTKIMRAWGSVSGFAQTVDDPFIDALTTELEGTLEGLSNAMEFATLFGCADDINFTGDPYQFSGILPRLYRFAAGNIIDGGGKKLTLDMLDQATAKVNGYRGVSGDPKAWLMGIRMKQIADGLQTRVQIPLSSMQIADGLITMSAYANAPILETDFVVPASDSSSPADLAGDGAAGGTLTAGAYEYRIASVTTYGEQVAAAHADVTVDPGESAVDLTWTADDLAKNYMIFRGGKLIDIIPALTYDADGKVNGQVETYTDKGKAAVEVKPLEAGEQQIVLVNRNPRRGVSFVGKVDDMGRTLDRLFSYVELARVKDSYDYMVKGYMALKLIYPNLISAVRHVKLA